MILRKIHSWDFLYIASVLLLATVSGLIMYGFSIDSTQNFFVSIFSRQIIYTLVGIVFFFLFSHIHYKYYQAFGTPLYFFAVILLVIVLIVGDIVRGTVGWIDLGFFMLQPVELVKIILVLFLASFFSKKRTQLPEHVRLMTSLVLTVFLIFLVLLQPDFGSAMILLGIWVGMLLISGIQKNHLLSLLIGGVFVMSVGWFMLADYQKERIVNVLNPEADARGSGYNVIQSMIAAGSGGFIGNGLGQGTQSQLDFLPEKHTDFIFASIAESLGFVGAVFVLILYGILLFRIKKIAQSTTDNFGYLVAVGFFIMLLIQITINIGMNIGIMPVTGIPLPLLSYGGSSLISSYIGLGIVWSIAKQSETMRKTIRTGLDDLSQYSIRH